MSQCISSKLFFLHIAIGITKKTISNHICYIRNSLRNKMDIIFALQKHTSKKHLELTNVVVLVFSSSPRGSAPQKLKSLVYIQRNKNGNAKKCFNSLYFYYDCQSINQSINRVQLASSPGHVSTSVQKGPKLTSVLLIFRWQNLDVVKFAAVSSGMIQRDT